MLLLPVFACGGAAAQEPRDRIAAELRELDTSVLVATPANPSSARDASRSMISADIGARRRAVNERDVAAWRAISNRAEWEAHRDATLAALKRSLGSFPEPPDDLRVRVTRSLAGDGFVIDCVVFESRPGLLVTANLYRPPESRDSMPGILICHSHHNPKTQGELQDMGMLWAKAGCYVLVMDQIGHGERRQHPFRSAADYGGAFRPSRQDYHFRYNLGMQLHLIGDSLVGWMAWDLMRGVDLLLGRPGIDPARIILLGAVAGGGDPAAVVAAIDRRIQAVVPFNFGGPQPETVFPLPDDAELSFNYAGGGSWESTRNLRLSARDGFLPWTIVAATAPRRLIYAHEFEWDRDHDPVWKRLESVFGFYDRGAHLSSLKGYGSVRLSSSEASHCNNIGALHRAQMHPAFQRWFGIVVSDPDFRDRREPSALLCVEGVETGAAMPLPPVHTLAGAIADERVRMFRERLDSATTDRIATLQQAWSGVLGGVVTKPAPSARTTTDEREWYRLVRFTLNPERDIMVPGLLLLPRQTPAGRRCPAVVAFAQSGKQRFLAERHAGIARLLEAGIGVCLPDLRGTGQSRPGDYRGRRSDDAGLSSSELMLGGTMVGSRLGDLLAVVQWLRTTPEVDGGAIAVWGESFAGVNPPDRRVDVPLDVDDEPGHCEPLGATLALLAGLFDADIQAVVARGGLVSLRSVLDSPFVHIPHDFVVPGSLTAGDLADVAAALAPRPLRVDGLCDGSNRRARSLAPWQPASTAYAPYPEKLLLAIGAGSEAEVAEWLKDALDQALSQNENRSRSDSASPLSPGFAGERVRVRGLSGQRLDQALSQGKNLSRSDSTSPLSPGFAGERARVRGLSGQRLDQALSQGKNLSRSDSTSPLSPGFAGERVRVRGLSGQNLGLAPHRSADESRSVAVGRENGAPPAPRPSRPRRLNRRIPRLQAADGSPRRGSATSLAAPDPSKARESEECHAHDGEARGFRNRCR